MSKDAGVQGGLDALVEIGAAVRMLVLSAREDLEIARQVRAVLGEA